MRSQRLLEKSQKNNNKLSRNDKKHFSFSHQSLLDTLLDQSLEEELLQQNPKRKTSEPVARKEETLDK